MTRDRDPQGRPRNARARDDTGRPLPRGATGDPPHDPEPLPPDEALRTAQALIDNARAFRAHEVLEAVWKSAPASERDLWRGLAQVAVALTHRARGNAAGAAALFARAADTLQPFAGAQPYAVDVDAVRASCRQAALRPLDDAATPRLESGQAADERA